MANGNPENSSDNVSRAMARAMASPYGGRRRYGWHRPLVEPGAVYCFRVRRADCIGRVAPALECWRAKPRSALPDAADKGNGFHAGKPNITLLLGLAEAGCEPARLILFIPLISGKNCLPPIATPGDWRPVRTASGAGGRFGLEFRPWRAASLFSPPPNGRARSSAVKHSLHTREVTGFNPCRAHHRFFQRYPNSRR